MSKDERDKLLRRKKLATDPTATTTLESLAMTLQTSQGRVSFKDVVEFVEKIGLKVVKNKSYEELGNLKILSALASIPSGSKIYKCQAPDPVKIDNPDDPSSSTSSSDDENETNSDFPDNRRKTMANTKSTLKTLGLNQKFEWDEEIPDENSVNPFKRFYSHITFKRYAGDSNEAHTLAARRTHVSHASNVWLQSQRLCDSNSVSHKEFDILLAKHPEAINACIDKFTKAGMSAAALKNKIQATMDFFTFYQAYLLDADDETDIRLSNHISNTLSQLSALRKRNRKIIKTNEMQAVEQMDPTVFESYVKAYINAVENKELIKKSVGYYETNLSRQFISRPV